MAFLFLVEGTDRLRRDAMNAPRYEPHGRSRPTQTFWPGTRTPDAPPAPRPHDANRDEKKEEDRPHDEPGYGHGV
jgi:hypothetical protein